MKKSLWTYEFRKNYCMVMARLKHNSRYSAKREPNTPERLAFIREKYKDGVPAGEVENWINSL